ncbi:hypothetical protein NT6N_13490 [Oceaniferula spumae]|uniref:Sulfatase N-terminal domain-containing protein n=1 Tax=Oceaniferula spumae TaxID=2979115 RepID=A0AAT9FJY5_9BACT
MPKLLSFILGAVLTAPVLVAAPSSTKPNIIFIMTDDVGYETVSYNKALNFKTPNIDRLSTESTVFTQADATPLCCPTRTRVVSGQYTYRNYIGWDGKIKKTAPFIAEKLKSAGYATAAMGKWHLGDKKSPARMGFDEHCLFWLQGMSQSDMMKFAYRNAPYLHNGKIVRAPYGPDLANEQARAFIKKNKDRPFFLYYTPWLCHNPFEPTPDSKDQNCTDWQTNFEDMVAYTDKLVGKIVKELKDQGIYENTVIVYTGDNGTKTCAHIMEDGTVIYGGKGTQTIDGCHVPLLVKTDGTHRTLDNLIDFADFYATFADLAGVPAKDIDPTIDGVSFAPLLRGETKTLRSHLFSFFRGGAFVRNQHYKYYIDQRIYDLVADPRENQPFYPESDTPETAKARKALHAEMTEIIQGERFKNAVHRKELLKTFERYQKPAQSRILGSRDFDGITAAAKSVSWDLDMTPYLTDKNSTYRLRFSRSYRTKNSHLIYSNARIKKVRVLCDGKEVFSRQPTTATLTTRPKAKVINPMVDFIYDESKARVGLKGLNIPEGTKTITLKIDADLTNPGNQWGDRIRLYTFLEKMD